MQMSAFCLYLRCTQRPNLFLNRGCIINRRLCATGAGWVVGWREAERSSCADLCKQAGPADSRPSLRDRRGSQPAHHPRSHVADPVLLRPHRRGDSGEHMSCVVFFYFCFYVPFFSSSHVLLSLKFTFRRVWIGSASLSTPRKNSFASSHLLLRRNSSTHTHTYTDIHCILLSVSMMGYICECKRTTNPTWTWSV